MRERPPGIDQDLLRALGDLTPEQRDEVLSILVASLPWWRRLRVRCKRHV